MSPDRSTDDWNDPGNTQLWIGACALIAALSLTPLIADPYPVELLAPRTALVAGGAKAAVLSLMLLAFAVEAWSWRMRECWIALAVILLLAAALVSCHWWIVDSDPVRSAWQREKYLEILNHVADAPHNYRALPYGFTRGVELLTHDWWFSCLAYRWFFTAWFLWGCYGFARRFLSIRNAWLSLFIVVALYPLSIIYYWGQLTDPMSHALFVFSMIFILDNRILPLAATLALGILAKETAILLVPAYAARIWMRPRAASEKQAVKYRTALSDVVIPSVFLAILGLAAFLAARLPLHWRPGYEAINGTGGLMIGTNLGIGTPLYIGSAPTWQNYAHPLVFVGVFIPPIIYHWNQVDVRLRAMFVTLTPLLLLSNLAFSWMYESRNYVPLLPLLTTMALPTKAGMRDEG